MWVRTTWSCFGFVGVGVERGGRGFSMRYQKPGFFSLEFFVLFFSLSLFPRIHPFLQYPTTHQPVLGPARVLRLVRQHDRGVADAEEAVGDQHRALVAKVPVLGDVFLFF